MNNEAYPRIAFVGGGNMARALLGGLVRQGAATSQLWVGEPLPAVRAALERELGVRTSADNGEVVRQAALVVLAMKPQVAAQVLQPLHADLQAQRPLVLSIVAGLRIADLARLCPAGLAIVRAMPNRPAMLAAGITGLYAPPSVTAAQRAMAERIARAAGRIVWLRIEQQLDIVTALSGSGPAYFFLLAEHLARAAVSLGLDHDTAVLLAVETLYGAGALARGEATLAEQRAAVTSKGGTTEAALAVLHAGGFEELVAAALRAAAARSAAIADSLAATLGSLPGAARS
ncbi:MAG TPA: pyrroline-5-carboxylate reductase [Steroidobacteraceae bacterium]